jgi:hypothetical protein
MSAVQQTRGHWGPFSATRDLLCLDVGERESVKKNIKKRIFNFTKFKDYTYTNRVCWFKKIYYGYRIDIPLGEGVCCLQSPLAAPKRGLIPPAGLTLESADRGWIQDV